MTVIEFYDSTAIHNVLSALLLSPHRLVLVGAKEAELLNMAKRIRSLFKGKQIHAVVETLCPEENTYHAVFQGVESLVLKYPDAVIDLVGGDATLLAVAGAISEKYGTPLHRAEPGTASVLPFSKKEAYPAPQAVSLSIREIISLYGGIIRESVAPQIKNEPFWKDVLSVWAVCRQDPGDFNTAVSSLHSLTSPENISPSVSMQKINQSLSPQKAEKVFTVLRSLSKSGALVDYNETDAVISFRYKSRSVQAAMHKEGSVLEFYTYYASLSDFGQGVPFSDGKIGVVMEWDHTDADDLQNEMDVMLMDGITPIFISCKNGYVGTEELYKLSVVAARFGGPYAKKAIVMTRQKADISFLARARELGITVISDVQEMTLAGFSKYLKRTLKNKGL